MTMINAAQIYSTLGNPKSLIPLAIKDSSATAGMTAGSFVTGKEEGQDRFIDEIGTAAIWLLGIPVAKWIFNKTVFKALGLNPEFDARNLKDKGIMEKIKEFAPDEKVKDEILKIEKKQKLFKNATSLRFVISTTLAIASYVMLTKFKQMFTENKIKQNLFDEYKKSLENNENISTENNSKPQEPSFKGLGNVVEYFAFNPVRNMWILDGSITIERLKDSRSPQEFAGYAIKEGMTLAFMYYAGGKIQKILEKHSTKKHNKNIALDARVLESQEFKKAFENGEIEKSLKEFENIKSAVISGTQKSSKLSKDSVSLYEFLCKNPDNFITKIAKKSDIIQTYKKTDKIDTTKYIDLENIEKTYKDTKELYAQFKTAIQKGETSEKFFQKLRKLKRQSIRLNIGSSILVLGVITPAIMLLKRFTDKSGEEFQTKKEIREQMIRDGIIA